MHGALHLRISSLIVTQCTNAIVPSLHAGGPAPLRPRYPALLTTGTASASKM